MDNKDFTPLFKSSMTDSAPADAQCADDCKSPHVTDLLYSQMIARIHYVMEDKHLSFQKVAEDAGISLRSLFSIAPKSLEAQGRSNTYLKTAMRIAIALDVSLDWLVFGKGYYDGVHCHYVLHDEPYQSFNDVHRDEDLNGMEEYKRVAPQVLSDLSPLLSAFSPDAHASSSPDAHASSAASGSGASPSVAPAANSAFCEDPTFLQLPESASTDVLLALCKSLQQQNRDLIAQHSADKTKNEALTAINASLQSTLNQFLTIN